jgi:hypothetical protein
MFRLLTTLLIGCVGLLPIVSYGQGRADIPLGALPMQFNPSFAGQVGGPRFNSNLNYLYNSSSSSSTQGANIYASYDQFISAIRSGIGITAGYGYSSLKGYGFNTLGNYTSGGANVSVAIAPKFSFKGKYTLSPSLDFSFGASTIEAEFRPPFDTLFDYLNGNHYGLNSRAGLLFNSNKLYVGYSINLLSRAIGDTPINPAGNVRSGYFESYLQAGYTFQKNSESKFSFTPQLVVEVYRNMYENKISIRPGSYNLNFRYKEFIWGLNNEE